MDDVSIVIIDDVLIWSETPEQHIHDVERVLDALAACGLRAHLDKSIFGADVIEYLGHNLSADGVSPQRAKVAGIMALQPPPESQDEHPHQRRQLLTRATDWYHAAQLTKDAHPHEQPTASAGEQGATFSQPCNRA